MSSRCFWWRSACMRWSTSIARLFRTSISTSSRSTCVIPAPPRPQTRPADPVVTEIDGTVFPVLRLAVAAPRNELDIKRLGDAIRDDLLELPGVAKAVVQGARKAEIRG